MKLKKLDLNNPRHKELFDKWGGVPGVVKVTEGGLFGHKEVLDCTPINLVKKIDVQ